MAAQTLFADAFYWIALLSPRDSHHSEAVAFSQTNASIRVFTTDEVLNEVLTHFCRSGNYWHGKVTTFVKSIRRDPLVEVLPQTPASFDDAFAFYESRLDKEYSLVDCRSMVAMRSLGLTDVLSNDRHFGQEGFTVLFP